MTKNISPVWFLKEPLDPEHKEYVLLDYLKSISKDLSRENCYSTLREISRIVRVINDFRRNKEIPHYLEKTLSKNEKEYVDTFNYSLLDESQKINLSSIIEDSLETLYEYSEICLDILKEEESKIRIFKIQNPTKTEKKSENSGIVIIRNMITDRLLNYLFHKKIKMETAEGKKEVSILKKIHTKNPFFSLNYEYIYNEILNEMDFPDPKYSPQIYVIEIYENFEESSEIYKLAKEKFIDYIGT